MDSSPIPPRMTHLRRYANRSHLAAHRSVTWEAIRLPPEDVTMRSTYINAVEKETASLHTEIAKERETISKLPSPPTDTNNKVDLLNTLLASQHVHSALLPSSLPPHFTSSDSDSGIRLSTNSPLPPLLLHQHLSESLTSLITSTIPTTRASIAHVQSQITAETRSLEETLTLTTSLRNRVEALSNELQRHRKQNTEEDGDEAVANHIISQHQAAIDRYAKAQRKLLREMSKFVSKYIGSMLAAEGIGGPVVGEDLEVDLSGAGGLVGYDKRGKLKREKGQKGIKEMFDKQKRKNSKTSNGKRLRDEGDDESEGESDDDAQEDTPPPNLAATAASDLKSLIEALMNASLTPQSPYVSVDAGSALGEGLAKDSAAARFLVRAGVAVFHPKDARKVRLVDFGRTIED